MDNKKRIILGGIALGFVALFIVWTLLVINGVTQKFDNSVVEAVVGFRGEKGGFWYWLVRITTELGNKYFIIAFLLVILVLQKLDLRSFVISIGAGTNYIIYALIKKVVGRARPLEIFQWMYESSLSYPSGHTANSTFVFGFSAYLILTSKLEKKYKIIISSILLFIIPWIGFTRIVLSVHYFSDVIGGLFLGIAVISCAIFILEEFSARGYNGLRNFVDKKLLKKN